MNHRHIANLVASVIQTDRNEKVRAIRLYVEKTSGIKVADSTQEELSDALVTAMDVTNVKVYAEPKEENDESK